MRPTNLKPSERLIVALDLPSMDAAMTMVAKLPTVKCFKVGAIAYAAGFGGRLRSRLVESGKRVMVDNKYLDIPNTMDGIVKALRGHAHFATIHASRQAMEAAQKALELDDDLGLLAVTVLTSLDIKDLRDDGYAYSVEELVLRRASYAAELGLCGVVASAEQVEMIRIETGNKLTIVTPGIRPAGAAVGDQKQVGTPEQAIRDGSDYLVVGRPIYEAVDPNMAARAIQEEIAKAVKAVMS